MIHDSAIQTYVNPDRAPWALGGDVERLLEIVERTNFGAVPTGTGFRHVSAGSEDSAAQLVSNADVLPAAAIEESKLALTYATHSNANDPTADEKAALVGTSGTPSASNPFVTDDDARLLATGSPPTGTGFRHVTGGVEDGAAQLVVNADVSASAAIVESKLSLNFATHSNANDPSADQKAALAGTSGTPSAANKYVTDGDSRMTNARTPTAHTHPLSDLTQSSASTDDVATWNGSAWVPLPAPGAGSGAAVGAKCTAGSFTLSAGASGGKTNFSTEVFDTTAFFSTAGEFTVPTGESGYYLMQAEALMSTVGYNDGERTLSIRNATTTTTIYAIARISHSTSEFGFNISGVAYLSAGDTIEVYLTNSTAVAQTVDVGRFSLMKLGT